MAMLNDYVLVLNKGWTPVAVARVKDAFVKLFNNSARIIDENTYETYNWDEWVDNFSFQISDTSMDSEFKFILSPRLKIRVPEVVVLTNYSKFPERKMKLTRKNLLRRDNYHCQYTGAKLNYDNATIDHVLPKSKGGRTTWDNVVICEESVNTKKADKTLDESGLKLLNNPVQPKWNPLFSVSDSKKMESWKKFLAK